MSKPVFLYFGLTGRVPAARIALFAAFGKDGWVDEIMDFPSFGAEKKKLADGAADAKLVSGSLPQLTLPSGKTVCQTLSIARWACCWGQANGKNVGGLYPSQDPDKFIIMDEVMSFAMEVLDRCPMDKDTEIKKTKREEYAAPTGFMGRIMQLLESRMGEVSGDFLLGEEPCLADFTLFGLVNLISVGQFDHIPANYVEKKFPILWKQFEAVKNCKLMHEYKEAYGKDL